MKYVVMSLYSICDMRFGIMKSELILGISVETLRVFSDKLFFPNLAGRQIPLFADNKKD